MHSKLKRRVIRRLKIAEGQVRGLQRQVEADTYCIGVLRQSAAIKQALSSVEDLILKGHLETHVVEHIKRGRTKETVKEIMDVFKASKQK